MAELLPPADVSSMTKASSKRRARPSTTRRDDATGGRAHRLRRLLATLRVVPKSAFFRPLACLLIILSAAGVAIFILSSPISKSVSVSAKCDGLELPFRTTVKLARAEYLHFRGFRADIDNIARGSIALDKGPVAVASGARVSLTSADQTRAMSLSATKVLPKGRRGQEFLDAAAGSSLDAARCVSPGQACFALTSMLADSVKASLQSEQFEIQAVRTKIAVDNTEVLPPSTEQTSLVVENTFSFPRISLASEAEAPSAANPMVSVIFPSNDPVSIDLQFVDAPASPVGAGGRVRLYRCSAPKVMIEGNEIPAAKTGHLTDLILSAHGLVIDKAMIATADAQRSLDIVLSANANSVLVDLREVLPTQLSEILDKSLATKSFLGLAAIFLIFAGGIFAKHSLELLAKLIIPTEK